MKYHPFRQKLGEKKVKYIQGMLTMVEPYMILEEKITTYFDNHASIESHFNRLIGKESHWRRDDSDWGMLRKYGECAP